MTSGTVLPTMSRSRALDNSMNAVQRRASRKLHIGAVRVTLTRDRLAVDHGHPRPAQFQHRAAERLALHFIVRAGECRCAR